MSLIKGDGMILRKKILHNLKTNMELMTDNDLQWMLKYYENDLEHIAAESGIKDLFICYNNYCEVDESLRNKYEQLQAKLIEVKQQEKNLNTINPSLYEQFHKGECDYFYEGSVADRIANQKEINDLELQIAALEAQEPRLIFKAMQDSIKISLESTMRYYGTKEKIKIILKEIESRENLLNQETNKQKKKS